MTDNAELQQLKDEADVMGIEYSPRIGVDALRKKIEEAKPAKSETIKDEVDEPVVTKKASKEEIRKNANKLERVTVVCMNPNKKNIPGEVVTFGNSVIGTIRRYVPFDTVTHAEAALVQMLRNRKFMRVTMKKTPEGVMVPERKSVPEFGIEVHPPLTQKELQDLADDQAKRGAID